MTAEWPALPYEEWHDTRDTLHRWMQVVGKIQLGLTPMVNHWWNVALHVTPHGLATQAMPHGACWFDMELDFAADTLHIRVHDGRSRDVALSARSVAEFYRDVMAALHALELDVRIWPMPVEIDDPIRLDADTKHHAYVHRDAVRFWEVVAHAADVLEQFRARFVGKASPVMFFWGTFDLAAARFSGRRAPPLAGASRIEREAYSHEVISAGWWPGDRRLPAPAFYSYAAPEPPGFADVAVPHAYYDRRLHGFYLHYDDVRRARHPEALLLDFFQRTYAAAAELGRWDRSALERDAA